MKKAEQGSEQQPNNEEQTEEQQTEGEQEQQTADEGEQQTEESTVEEVVVTIGEESPPPEEDEKQAPEWVRELRKNHRELVRENRELKEKVAATTTTETKPVTVDVITSTGESGVLKNMLRKTHQADAMFAALVRLMGKRTKRFFM